LTDEVVEARPPSRGYRLRKFVSRHRGPVIAAAAVFVALVGGIAGTTVGLMEARQARVAEAERADGERRAKEEADDARIKAQKAESAALDAAEKLTEANVYLERARLMTDGRL